MHWITHINTSLVLLWMFGILVFASYFILRVFTNLFFFFTNCWIYVFDPLIVLLWLTNYFLLDSICASVSLIEAWAVAIIFIISYTFFYWIFLNLRSDFLNYPLSLKLMLFNSSLYISSSFWAFSTFFLNFLALYERTLADLAHIRSFSSDTS